MTDVVIIAWIAAGGSFAATLVGAINAVFTRRAERHAREAAAIAAELRAKLLKDEDGD